MFMQVSEDSGLRPSTDGLWNVLILVAVLTALAGAAYLGFRALVLRDIRHSAEGISQVIDKVSLVVTQTVALYGTNSVNHTNGVRVPDQSRIVTSPKSNRTKM